MTRPVIIGLRAIAKAVSLDEAETLRATCAAQAFWLS